MAKRRSRPKRDVEKDHPARQFVAKLRRLAAHNASVWGPLYAEWVQRDLGMMGEYATHPRMGLGLALNSVAAMRWRQSVGREIYRERFVEFVERAIADLDGEEDRARIAKAGFRLDSD